MSIGRSYHQQPKPIRTGPLLVGCVLLLAVPLSVLNIISTTTRTFTRSDHNSKSANDLPTIDHAWEIDSNNQQRQIQSQSGESNTKSLLSSTSSKYQGQSWIASTSYNAGDPSDSGIVVAETSLAKCEVYHQPNGEDHIVFEEQDVIHIVVVDTRDRVWILHHQNGKDSKGQRQSHHERSPYFAVPVMKNQIRYSPVMGYSTNSNEAPWYAAHRIVAQVLGVLPKTTTHTDTSMTRVVLDENGIKDGSIPGTKDNAYNEVNSDWIFLGRHRTMADRGGGFVYSYLLRNVPGSPSDTNASPETVALSKEEVQHALQNGQFTDARGIASVTLALLHS